MYFLYRVGNKIFVIDSLKVMVFRDCLICRPLSNQTSRYNIVSINSENCRILSKFDISWVRPVPFVFFKTFLITSHFGVNQIWNNVWRDSKNTREWRRRTGGERTQKVQWRGEFHHCRALHLILEFCLILLVLLLRSADIRNTNSHPLLSANLYTGTWMRWGGGIRLAPGGSEQK